MTALPLTYSVLACFSALHQQHHRTSAPDDREAPNKQPKLRPVGQALLSSLPHFPINKTPQFPQVKGTDQ